MQYNGLMCAAIVARLSPYQQAIVRCAGQLGAHSYQDAIESGHAVGAFIAVGKKESDKLRHAPLISPDRCPMKWRSYNVTLVIDMRRVSRSEEGALYKTATSQESTTFGAPVFQVYEMKIMHWSYPRSIMRLGRVIEASRLIIGPPAYRNGLGEFQFPQKFLSCGKIFRRHFTLLDMSGLATTLVYYVPSKFLVGTSLPAHVDLSPLQNIREIGNNFMYNCEIVNEIDFNPMVHLEVIGDYFMNHVRGLKHVTMSKLTKLVRIGSNFMYGCKDLKSIDISPEATIKEIGICFLHRCWQLLKFDITPFREIIHLPTYLIVGCSKIVEMDLSPLTSIKAIGDYVFSSCVGLQKVVFPSGIRVSEIGSAFMCSTAITSIDLTMCSEMTTVSEHFLADCSNIKTSINLAPLSNVTTIAASFLARCVALTHLDFAPMVRLEDIGPHFLYGCIGLKSVNLTGLGSEIIGGDGIDEDVVGDGNKKCTTTTIKIGVEFMAHCPILRVITLTPPPPLPPSSPSPSSSSSKGNTATRHYTTRCMYTALKEALSLTKKQWEKEKRDNRPRLQQRS